MQATEVQVWAQVRVTLKPLIPVFPCFSNITISLMTKVRARLPPSTGTTRMSLRLPGSYASRCYLL